MHFYDCSCAAGLTHQGGAPTSYELHVVSGDGASLGVPKFKFEMFWLKFKLLRTKSQSGGSPGKRFQVSGKNIWGQNKDRMLKW